MRQAGVGSSLSAALAAAVGGALLLLIGPGLRASPLKAPRRLVNGQVVELKPLFIWWTNHSGTRPLAAWVHLTGPVIGTNELGWIIDAEIHRSSAAHTKSSTQEGAHNDIHPKILLQRPPQDDLAEFERITTHLKNLNEEHARLSNEESLAKSQEQRLERQRSQVRYDRASSRVLDLEDRQLKQADNQVKSQLKVLDQQIQAVKTQLARFPSPDHYVLDCFALDEGRNFEHMPLYDHGIPYP